MFIQSQLFIIYLSIIQNNTSSVNMVVLSSFYRLLKPKACSSNVFFIQRFEYLKYDIIVSLVILYTFRTERQ